MGYLDAEADATDYGLPSSVTQAQINSASDIVDAYLRRPEGLVYVPDDDGWPAYMEKLTPRTKWTLVGAIQAGKNVVCNVRGMDPNAQGDLMSEVLILDRGQPTMEAVYILSYTATTVTLSEVKYAHADGCMMESGLVILEEVKMAKNRSTTQVKRPNPARILSLCGRYGQGRHSDLITGDNVERNMLVTLNIFGPPIWVPVSVPQTSISLTTGEIWVPAGIMLAYYTDVRIRYVAGWTQENLPSAIKRATALIVQAIVSGDGVFEGGNFSSVKAGDTEFRRPPPRGASAGPRRAGADSPYLVPDAKAMLDPFRVRGFR